MVDKKKVVLRKPKMDNSKQINIKPLPPPEQDPKLKSKQKKNQKKEPVREQKTNQNSSEEQEEIEISEELFEGSEILTSSNKKIIARPQPEITNNHKSIIEEHSEKRNIIKNPRIMERLQKPMTINSMQQDNKKKRRINIYAIISLIAFILLTILSYFTLKEYVTSSDESLASLIYVISIVILTIMVLTWFIIEIIVKERRRR